MKSSITKTSTGSATSGVPKEFSSGSPNSSGSRPPERIPWNESVENSGVGVYVFAKTHHSDYLVRVGLYFRGGAFPHTECCRRWRGENVPVDFFDCWFQDRN